MFHSVSSQVAFLYPQLLLGTLKGYFSTQMSEMLSNT